MANPKVKDPNEFINRAMGIVKLIGNASQRGRSVSMGDLSKGLNTHPTVFSKSAHSTYGKAYRFLLEHSMIAGREQGRFKYLSLLKPVEDIEAYFSNNKKVVMEAVESKVTVTRKPKLKDEIKAREVVLQKPDESTKVYSVKKDGIDTEEAAREKAVRIVSPYSVVVESQGVKITINLNSDGNKNLTPSISSS